MLGELTDKRHEAITDYGWELILVNDDNFMPEDYKINLLTLSNGQQVDERIYPHLQEMFDDMRKQGHSPIVVSGYRSEAEQEAILKDKIKAFEWCDFSSGNNDFSKPTQSELYPMEYVVMLEEIAFISKVNILFLS